ncbi:GerAB/ArcD/ProY family transporter [Domibacillus iocasae]|uniref:Spore gernimation protein KB n=1 Tax=Domibacillus iocasae TaxID=1714016 RepID=A0A1E7DU43_9BACI|nr:GerAB/ArcD/ProY family transporter [Domibacillus iocasae]OES46607.1 spore gernimation protein KB [Domibacillus iocasae]
MEKAKISAYQLFVLIVLFELGSAMLIPLAIEAKQDAWLAILIGMAAGFCLFLVYYSLYAYYPDTPPTDYAQKIMGTVLGRMIAFLYVLYFVYLSARVVRDFGEMLVIVFYPETPLFIMNALMVLVAVYTVRKGIEVLARTGELLFVLVSLLAISGLFLIVVAGIIEISNLQPVLEEGMKPVIKTAFTQTLYFPFGEIVVFMMILPYLNQPKKAKRTGLLALGISGVTLALIMALNTSVLGVATVERSLFPLLSTIQAIEVAGFLERLDVSFMVASVIGGFFKITLFFYVSVAGTASLFKIKEPTQLAYPLGVVILLLSMMIASNFTEHLQEGVDIVPLYVHFPFQVMIPVILLIIAFFKKGKQNDQAINK